LKEFIKFVSAMNFSKDEDSTLYGSAKKKHGKRSIDITGMRFGVCRSDGNEKT